MATRRQKNHYTHTKVDLKSPPPWLLYAASIIYNDIMLRAQEGMISPTVSELADYGLSNYEVERALWLMETGNLLKIEKISSGNIYFLTRLGIATKPRKGTGMFERQQVASHIQNRLKAFYTHERQQATFAGVFV